MIVKLLLNFAFSRLNTTLGILLVILPGVSFSQGLNILQGKVIYPQKRGRVIQGMNGYQGSQSQAPALRADDGILYLLPLDFYPEIQATQNAVLTQKNMTFIPHVLPLTVGSTLYILNEDNEYHNVFSRTPRSSFNIGRRPPGHLYPQRITRTGIIRVFCDIHEEMSAFILSLDTPYYTRVGWDGTYQVRNLPDGRYRLVIFHPELRNYSQEVAVNGGRIQTLHIQWQ